MTRAALLALALALALALGLAGAAQAQDWPTFNGDLRAQKFSPLTQITPENVGQLRPAWSIHTGDVSDGVSRPTRMHGPAGQVPPPTVWSATPLFVNDTLYVGTPFYRILALEPGTGAIKWTYDSHAVLEALTQPDLKNRGVAYWAAADPATGEPCQKRIYLGTMDAKLHAVDADTGQPCADFGQGGVLDFNTFNTTDAQWPLSLLQPPTVFGDTLFVGWAGKDWAEAVDSPGSVYALDARTGAVKWTFETLPPELRARPAPPTSGPRCRSTPSGTSSTSRSPRRAPTSSRAPSPSISPRHLGHRARHRHRRDGLEPPARPPRPLGPRHQRRADARRHREGRPDHPGPRPDLEAGLSLRPRPHDRRAGLSDRGAPGPAIRRPGEISSPTQPFVDRPARVIPDRWPGVSKLADFVCGGWCTREAAKLRDEGSFTPPSLKGTLVYPGTVGGTEWGGGAVDPSSGIYVVNSSSVVQIYRRSPAPTTTRRRPGRRDRRLLAADRRPLRHPARHLPHRSACPAGTRPTARSPPTT